MDHNKVPIIPKQTVNSIFEPVAKNHYKASNYCTLRHMGLKVAIFYKINKFIIKFLQIANLDSFKCWDKSRATNSPAVGAVGAVRWETFRRCFSGVFVFLTFDAWPMRQPWHRAPFLHPQPYHHPLTLPPMIFLSHFYRTRVRSLLPGLVSN